MPYYKYDFYKYVAPDVYGCPMPVIEDTAEDVIIDFCRKTSFYRQWLEDLISVAVDDVDVELDLPRNTTVVEVMTVQKVDGNETPIDEYLNDEDFTFSNQDDSGTARLVFREPAQEAFDARVRVALRPVVGFTIVPDWLYEDWRDAIVAGIKARLLSMRSKAWYALTESEQYRLRYNEEIRRASRVVVLETVNKIRKPPTRYI
jgi:hypothetical protein